MLIKFEAEACDKYCGGKQWYRKYNRGRYLTGETRDIRQFSHFTGCVEVGERNFPLWAKSLGFQENHRAPVQRFSRSLRQLV